MEEWPDQAAAAAGLADLPSALPPLVLTLEEGGQQWPAPTPETLKVLIQVRFNVQPPFRRALPILEPVNSILEVLNARVPYQRNLSILEALNAQVPYQRNVPISAACAPA